MQASNPMKPLYKRLSDAGIKESFVREKVLPYWWKDEIATSPAGYQQAAIILIRNLGLESRSVLGGETPIAFRAINEPKYKLRSDDSHDDVQIATRIAYRAVQFACDAAVSKPNTPGSAMEVRRAILARGKSCVDFEALLDYCWHTGIPVLHVCDFPKGVRKPEAIAAIHRGRSAIVLCKNTDYSAWQLFHLAHELGHVALGHLEGVGLLVDGDIVNNNDAEEIGANTYAVELLSGSSEPIGDFYPANASNLAATAATQSANRCIDAGFIALSNGRHTGRWALANAALKKIEPGPNAIAAVRRKMIEYLDLSILDGDSREYLLKITGADESA